MRRALVLLLLAGCAGADRSPTLDDIERLLHRRWTPDHIREYCRGSSRLPPVFQRLVRSSTRMEGYLHTGDPGLGQVHFTVTFSGGKADQYQVSVDKGEWSWVLETEEIPTLRRTLTSDEVAMMRFHDGLWHAGLTGPAERIMTAEDVVQSLTGRSVVWSSAQEGRLEGRLDGKREIEVLLVNGREDVEATRTYRAYARP